jgi:hypothetical protein
MASASTQEKIVCDVVGILGPFLNSKNRRFLFDADQSIGLEDIDAPAPEVVEPTPQRSSWH